MRGDVLRFAVDVADAPSSSQPEILLEPCKCLHHSQIDGMPCPLWYAPEQAFAFSLCF